MFPLAKLSVPDIVQAAVNHLIPRLATVSGALLRLHPLARLQGNVTDAGEKGLSVAIDPRLAFVADV